MKTPLLCEWGLDQFLAHWVPGARDANASAGHPSANGSIGSAPEFAKGALYDQSTTMGGFAE